ncbi:hypothetical protein [Nostoc sp.]|uniref:hypothetical protein n=1 Tax=Nostoc sp. TaxID=1180 RepID=UPI002FF670A2
MAMEKYPLDWLKTSCEQVYCRTIAERTWRKWLRLCQVPQYAREVVKEQALWLLTLAYLKKPDPSKKVTLFQVKFKLAENEIVEFYLAEEIYNACYTNAIGKDLPEIILRVTGKQISLRTLYRRAKKRRVTLKASQKLTRPEVEQWIEWATA